MKNRIRVLGLILLLIGCLATVKSQESNLVVKLKNGISNSLSLRNIKKINFAISIMNINVIDGKNAVYTNTDIQKLYFENSTEVPSVNNNRNMYIYPNPTTGLIFFKGLTDELVIVQLFDLTGVQVFSGKVNSSVQSLDISFLTKGIYLITMNNQLEKLIKL
jgi:hypothetical protein